MTKNKIELNRAGNRFIAKKDYPSARQVFNKLANSFPGDPEGFIGVAKVLKRQNKYEDLVLYCEPHVDKLNSSQLYRLLGDACRVLCNRGKSQYVTKAIYFYELYHQYRKDPVTLYYLGDIYFIQQKNYRLAAWAYRESWDHDPRSRPAYTALRDCLYKLGEDEKIPDLEKEWDIRTQ